MPAIRFMFRFVFFLIGVAAMAFIFSIGYVFLKNGNTTEITISAGNDDDPGIGRSPENLEDLALSLLLQRRAEEINTPMSQDSSDIPFTVESGELAPAIAERLQSLGLISDAELFRQFLRYNQLDTSIEAGDYVLRRNMTMPEIAQVLQRASFEEVTVTIPEGLRAEEIAALLEEADIMPAGEFMIAVEAGSDVQHSLLADKPGGASYEGYLFPDTYRLPLNASPEDIIERMLDNMEARLPSDVFDLAAQQGHSFHDILKVASIVEREAVIAEERPTIASVYLNRIKQDMYLQADPTVQYAMGYQPATGQWWKTPVTLEEYSEVDSPYNTYLTPGLPPTPIANPGIDSIMATLQPAETNYLFFVAFENGAHVFAETFEEHEQNVARYQGQ